MPTSPASDAAILLDLGRRLLRARIDLDLTQAQLAREAGVAKRTIERLEGGGSVQLTNLVRVLRVLGLLEALARLVPDAPPSPISQADRGARVRQRVRHRQAPRAPAAAKPFRWGDGR